MTAAATSACGVAANAPAAIADAAAQLPPSDNQLAQSLDRSFEQLATEAGLAGEANTAFLIALFLIPIPVFDVEAAAPESMPPH